MEKLIPLEVPWEISPSNPGLKLVLDEQSDQYVDFGVFILVTPVARAATSVRVKFQHGHFYRCTPNQREHEPRQSERYDWSGVPFQVVTPENVHTFMDDAMAAWGATGLAPNPRAYRVENSNWLSGMPELNQKIYQHLLFIGEDISVEALTVGWTWEYKSPAGELFGWR